MDHAGTAAVLSGAAALESLKAKYDLETAYGIAARELRSVDPRVTRQHVEGFDLVFKALATGAADLEAAGQAAEADGRVAAESLLREVGKLLSIQG